MKVDVVMRVMLTVILTRKWRGS